MLSQKNSELPRIAAAHKIARILYHLVTTRERYDESVFAVMKQRAQ